MLLLLNITISRTIRYVWDKRHYLVLKRARWATQRLAAWMLPLVVFLSVTKGYCVSPTTTKVVSSSCRVRAGKRSLWKRDVPTNHRIRYPSHSGHR